MNGEKNGKGKVSGLWNTLIFEGEFVNGKRNGKGREYGKKGRLIYEGEYLNDEKIKGRGYHDGILEYEGEYLFNKKWKGKGYNKTGRATYELINGNGKVKEYSDYEYNI